MGSSFLGSALNLLNAHAKEVSSAAGAASAWAAVAVADAALQQSGRCDFLIGRRHKARSFMTPLLASGLQESDVNPSLDAATCQEVSTNVGVAELNRAWNDGTGLVGKLAAGFAGEQVSHICGPALMSTLRSQEAIRKSDPEAYKEYVSDTLLNSVLTEEWIDEGP